MAKVTKRELSRMLRTETRIECLNLPVYLCLLALKIEIGSRDLTVRLADLVKCF